MVSLQAQAWLERRKSKMTDDDGRARTSSELTQEDIERYLPMLEDSDVTEAQKIEYLQTVWGMTRAFVDAAWDEKLELTLDTTVPG
jgi:hypothetical protein